MREGGARVGSSRAQALVFVVGLVLVTVAIVLAETAPRASIACFWDNVHWTLAYAFATVVSASGWRDAEGATRNARAWLTASLVAMTVGQLMWDAQILVGFNPFPGPSDLPFLTVGVCIFCGLATQLARLPGAERAAYALDALGITFAVLTLTLALYLPHRGDFGTAAAIILVAYPVILLGSAGVSILVVLAHRVRPTLSDAHFFVSLLALGVCWILWNWQTLEGTISDAAPLNYAFSYTALSFGVAAARYDVPNTRREELERPYYVVSSSIPLLLVLLASVAVVFGQSLGPVTYVAIRVCVVVVVLAAVARQSLLLRARDDLLAAERTIYEKEERFRLLAESIDEVFVITEGGSDRPIYLGPAFERIWGRPTDALLEGAVRWSACIHEDDRDRYVRAMSERAASFVIEYRIVRADAAIRWVRDRRTRVEGDVRARIVGIVEDVTEQRRASERTLELQTLLAKAERLKSVGTLAGGIAHDFNNILAAVLGNAEIASATLPESGRARTAIDGILAASERARDLVKRMLAFARNEDAEVSPVSLVALAHEVRELLRPVVPSSIEMVVYAGDDVPSVMADPAQLHQVLVNLVTNASHAIGDRAGHIVIRVAERFVRRGELVDVAPGRVVELSVHDDGHGMDDATRARIFDPFFTTKQPGEGTGLGLSMVHGIISSHGGTIDVVSSMSEGTTFRIVLPAAATEARVSATPQGRSRMPDVPLDAEVLVVDDDEMVGRALGLLLASLGVHAVATRSPDDALALVTAAPSRFALVVTDMTMPRMRGDELGERIRAVAPALPIVLVSGNELSPAPGLFAAVLAKPYTRAMLEETLRRCLPDARHAVAVET